MSNVIMTKNFHENTYKDTITHSNMDGSLVWEREVLCCSKCDCCIPPEVFQQPCDTCWSKSDWYKDNEY